MLEDLRLLAEPNPMMIESLYKITDRDRTPWDCETLLMMAIERQSMQQRARDKDCQKPYSETLSTEEAEDRNESVVSSFFQRTQGN